MIEEKYVNFMFDCRVILVKIVADVKVNWTALMEKAYEMNEKGVFEDSSYEEIIEDLLKEFNINDYKFIDVVNVDMEYAFEMN